MKNIFKTIVLILSLISAAGAQNKKIISLTPNFTEILYAIGAGDNIIGISDYSNYPPEVKSITKVGGLFNLNFEAVLSLKPDLVIMPPSLKGESDKLKGFGIMCLVLKNETVEDIIESITEMGKATGFEKQAVLLSGRIKNKLTSISARVKSFPKKKVLFLIGKSPGTLQGLTAAGKYTFINELITAAGGENIIKTGVSRYPKISKESLVELDPDIIFDASYTMGTSSEDMEREKKLWKMLPTLKAVKNNRIIYLTEDFLLIPGPRITQIAEIFLSHIHPDAK